MARKNIFELVEENYNISTEIKKIEELFFTEKYFHKSLFVYSLKDIVSKFLFSDWKLRGTCISVDEFLERVNANLPNSYQANEEQIINYLEVLENFIKLYNDNSGKLYNEQGIECNRKFNIEFCELINTLEKRMGLTTREYKDRIIIYPQNAPLEQVVDLCEDEDVQWELIRYVREDLSLSEKRKSLAYLATNLYIESDKKESNAHITDLIDKAENVLNNLHIRHNNKTGKWENELVESIDEKDALSLCDMVFNEMLTIVLLREHKKYDKTYTDFKKEQKATRTKKKTEVKNKG